ncbi:MAG: hypothetical protein K6F23_06495 [Solobacterium sp.]|nr:hypothetical protein [Solobacterium sp.]
MGHRRTEIMIFLYPLVLTLIIELAAAYMLGVRSRRSFLIIFLANCLTNPLLTISISLLPAQALMRKLIIYGIFEPVVILSEFLIYRYDLEEDIKPFRLSLILNLASVLGGLLWLSIF